MYNYRIENGRVVVIDISIIGHGETEVTDRREKISLLAVFIKVLIDEGEFDDVPTLIKELLSLYQPTIVIGWPAV